MATHSMIITFLGGITLFMYGMALASDYLQKLAANRVRQLMNHLQDKKFLAVGGGALLTVLLQSSGAVTTMLVNLASAGVVNLSQVMGVIVGSAIGSTFTVQIISFNLSQWGLGILIVSFAVFFITKQRVLKNIMGVAIGFGLLFFGIELMSLATNEFRSYKQILDILEFIKGQPFVAVLLTATITGFVHSSAVVIGFAMTLAQTNLIGIDDAIYWIYGANIGTTATALLAAVGTNHVGRQVAWAHFFYKIGSVIIFLPFTAMFAEWMLTVDPIESRAIANSHTIFNIISAMLFLPFLGTGVKLVEKYFPPREDEKEFGPKYINKESRVAYTIAYAQSLREALRMGDIVAAMVQDSIKLFESQNPDLIEDLHARDTKVDILFREIKSFLVRFSDESGHFSNHVLELLAFVTDIENAADIVDKNLVELCEKKQALQLEFSHQGWLELQELHRTVCETLTASLSCVQLQDKTLATEVIAKKRQLRMLERKMRESHLERLNRGLRESINTSSIHLELLSDWRRIASLFSNHAYGLLNEEKLGNGHAS